MHTFICVLGIFQGLYVLGYRYREEVCLYVSGNFVINAGKPVIKLKLRYYPARCLRNGRPASTYINTMFTFEQLLLQFNPFGYPMIRFNQATTRLAK